MKEHSESKGSVREVYAKAILMGVAMLLLVAALIFFTTAWYTKMVSTAGIDFQAAQWDFTANHTIDAISVNVYEYESLQKNYVAPGTAGWIPIKLGAWQSHTNVDFVLYVDKTTMSQEFQERIRFFYEDQAGEKVEFLPDPDDPTRHTLMHGQIPKGGGTEVKLYWEWTYEIPDKENKTDAEILAWDEFDTAVGENPGLYKEDMTAMVVIVGTEVLPQTTDPRAG